MVRTLLLFMLPWFVSLVFLPSHVHACLSFPLPPEVLAPANSDKPSTACSLDPTHCADTRRKACVGCLLRLSSGWIDHLKCQFFPLKLRARFLFTSALETTQNTLQMLIIVANLHSPHSYLIASAKNVWAKATSANILPKYPKILVG